LQTIEYRLGHRDFVTVGELNFSYLNLGDASRLLFWSFNLVFRNDFLPGNLTAKK
jgi:hypothetical protein